MTRKIYQPTEKQEKTWATLRFAEQPTDDEFRAMWAKAHRGKVAGWGLGKRQWIISNLSGCREYQMGLWQGRVDFICGLPYQEKQVSDENANAYNLGYYRGYTNCQSDMRGMDANSKARLVAYVEN